MLLASLYNSEGGWLKRVATTVLQGVALDSPSFAPATGYIAFFTLALYAAGLVMLAFADDEETTNVITHRLVDEYRQLPAAEQVAVREAILDDQE
jgi:hypothetical protein